MLSIFEPVTCVFGAVLVEIDPFAMSLVIFPFANVDIAIGVDESAHTTGFVVDPVSFVEREVLPDLFASAISHPVGKLPNVGGPILQLDGPLCYEFRVQLLVVFEGAQSGGHLPRHFVIEVGWLQVISLR